MSCLSTNLPDLVSVNETWLFPDILGNEITIPNFQIYCLDKNRHGGGLSIYVHASLRVVPLNLHNCLEVLIITVKLHECTFRLEHYIDLLP